MWLLIRTGCDRAKELIARAIEIDINFSAAYAVIGFVAMLEYINGWSKYPEEKLEEAHALAEKAVRLDDREPFAHTVLGAALLWMREHERSIAETERALALEPNFAAARISLGLEMHYAGRYEEALGEFNRGLRLDPHFSDGFLHFWRRRICISAATMRPPITRARGSRETRRPMPRAFSWPRASVISAGPTRQGPNGTR